LSSPMRLERPPACTATVSMGSFYPVI
jgi:hypothetical protein